MDQRIIDLYDDFTHGGMNRRTFLDRLAALVGSAAGATAILPILQNNYAHAQTVQENDPRITTQMVDIPGAQGLKGYLAKPATGTDLPAVIVIHENRGLNPHIKDVTRRMATEGFLALGVDYLSPMGGTPADEDKGREMIGQLKQPDVISYGKAAVDYLQQHPDSNGNVGAVGFCWGGGAVNTLAVNEPDLKAGVAYYGRQPDPDDVGKIQAPLMHHYASLDERINAGIQAFETAMKQAGKTLELHMYEGVNHAFNNDTNAARYDKEAADLAWQRTVAFFKKHLT
ncbi:MULTISPECIES: dienelactone hydrolase family protein [Microvirga]|uniref:dienelactone hydrolase family protein n=1 Tax=Microvirga TaxID=186650 RepID=UPI001CFFB49C|nr:dienelactone hydrolase family protein [Microvirga lenta]MCB5176818.1 dienelactone hydrolase family protein [Microvirga lenta]